MIKKIKYFKTDEGKETLGRVYDEN